MLERLDARADLGIVARAPGRRGQAAPVAKGASAIDAGTGAPEFRRNYRPDWYTDPCAETPWKVKGLAQRQGTATRSTASDCQEEQEIARWVIRFQF